MDEFYKCSRILVSNNSSNLSLPKTGECSLNINENYGTITLKISKCKKYFNSKTEEEVLTHHVNNTFKKFVNLKIN